MKKLLSVPRLTLCASFALLASPAFAHMGVVHEGCAAGQTFGDGDITVSQAFTRAMLAGARVGAGYMTIANSGTANDRLLAAASEVSQRVELHQMVMDNDMMRMSEIEDGIEVPAGGSVALTPGGLHVMFMEPGQEFQEGECVNLTLSFERAGDIEVQLSVGPVGASAAPDAHDHGAHVHGTHGDHSAAATDPHHAHHASMANVDQTGMDDAGAIAAMQKAMFETPENPLEMGPIVVVGEYAISGWAQGGLGGRALLRKAHSGWAIHLCAGAGLKDAADLIVIGVPESIATKLAAALDAAEAALPAEQVALYDSFDGTMMVDEDLI